MHAQKVNSGNVVTFGTFTNSKPTPLTLRQRCVNRLARLHDWFEGPLGASLTFFGAIITVVLFSLLSSCATLERNPATAKLATQYGVAKFIENSSIDKREDRRKRIVSIATTLKASAQDESATVAALQALAYAQIDDAKLSPADVVLAKALVDMIAHEIDTRIKDKLISPDKVVTINKFLDWIVEAAGVAT